MGNFLENLREIIIGGLTGFSTGDPLAYTKFKQGQQDEQDRRSLQDLHKMILKRQMEEQQRKEEFAKRPAMSFVQPEIETGIGETGMTGWTGGVPTGRQTLRPGTTVEELPYAKEIMELMKPTPKKIQGISTEQDVYDEYGNVIKKGIPKPEKPESTKYSSNLRDRINPETGSVEHIDESGKWVVGSSPESTKYGTATETELGYGYFEPPSNENPSGRFILVPRPGEEGNVSGQGTTTPTTPTDFISGIKEMANKLQWRPPGMEQGTTAPSTTETGQPVTGTQYGGTPLRGLKGPEKTTTMTPIQITIGALEEELGRKATPKEIQERVKKEAKGYDTPEEAFAEAQRMVAKAGPDAGLVPSYELSPQNKYLPKTQSNITLRIPPFVQGQNLPPGIVFNRKTGKYTDTTSGKAYDRPELTRLYGDMAVMNADKMALGELTKRYELISTFTNRIEANVPIVLDAIKDVGNTNPRLLNQAVNKSQQYLMGSGKWVALQTAILALSNEVQRVESNALGIGGQGQEERKMWAKIHDPNMTLKDWEDITKMISKLSHTAKGAVNKQRQDLSRRIPSEGLEGIETQTPIGGSSNVEDLRKKYNY